MENWAIKQGESGKGQVKAMDKLQVETGHFSKRNRTS
jgi:hypothetical protein